TDCPGGHCRRLPRHRRRPGRWPRRSPAARVRRRKDVGHFPASCSPRRRGADAATAVLYRKRARLVACHRGCGAPLPGVRIIAAHPLRGTPMSDIVIVAAKRTAIGSFLGQFNGVPTPTLGAAAIGAALEQSGLAAADVSEVIMGCVLPANLGQAPARQAALAAGLPVSAGCTTINKVCGSGMKAIMLGHDLIRAGSAEVVVAGGMESMTNAPHMVAARTGIRYGDGTLVDHMAWDGLTNPYDGKSMGVFAENCADKFHFTREQQDAFAIASVTRAKAAIESGAFADEIVPVKVATRKGEVEHATDEQPGRSDPA